jgi:hypothetical protein
MQTTERHMQDELKALREEIAKLRERVAVLESCKAAPLFDWTRPLQVGPHKWSNQKEAFLPNFTTYGVET